MSGVHVSNRQDLPVPVKFKALVRGVDESATRVAAKVIPKSYRFIIGTHMADAANELAELADMAEQFYPANSLMAHKRKVCYSRAIAKAKTLKRLADKAQRLNLAKASDFETMISELNEVIAIAHALKKNARVRGQESVQDQIAWHQAQIDSCLALESQEVTS